MSDIIQFPATLVRATRHVDKTVSVTHRSNFEMTTEDFSQIDRRLNDNGYSTWSSNEIQANEIPSIPADEAYGKMSDSQYQRWILKKIYEKTNTDLEWPDWYHQQEAKINNRLLDKLKELEI